LLKIEAALNYDNLLQDTISGKLKLYVLYASASTKVNDCLVIGNVNNQIFRVSGLLKTNIFYTLCGMNDLGLFVSVKIPKYKNLISYDLHNLAFYDGKVRKATYLEKRLIKSWRKLERKLFECPFDYFIKKRRMFCIKQGNHEMFKTIFPYGKGLVLDYNKKGDIYFKAKRI